MWIGKGLGYFIPYYPLHGRGIQFSRPAAVISARAFLHPLAAVVPLRRLQRLAMPVDMASGHEGLAAATAPEEMLQQVDQLGVTGRRGAVLIHLLFHPVE